VINVSYVVKNGNILAPASKSPPSCLADLFLLDESYLAENLSDY